MKQVDKGFLLGFFVGQGSFGGDGRTPQVTVRMHVSHHALLLRLSELLPGSQIYGPYAHGDRQYYQWMLRGDELVTFVNNGVFEGLQEWDEPSYLRYREMVDHYFVDGKLKFRQRKRRRKVSKAGNEGE